MTEHDDKQVASVDTVANAEPSKGRRRLVKGAMLATPAVMTLMSGRLASATSVLCRDKPVSLQPDLENIDGIKLIINPQNSGQVGYYEPPDSTTFKVVGNIGDYPQTAWHSATCWDSAYPNANDI